MYCVIYYNFRHIFVPENDATALAGYAVQITLVRMMMKCARNDEVPTINYQQVMLPVTTLTKTNSGDEFNHWVKWYWLNQVALDKELQ